MNRRMIYLDHAASTTMRQEAIAAMQQVWADSPANPTGAHGPAQTMRTHLELAREQISRLCGVKPSAVVFTSGGTESDNWAISAGARRGRVLYSAIEHAAVVEPAIRAGGESIPVDANGVVDLIALKARLRQLSEEGVPVGVVSVMAANNETGVIQPLLQIGRMVRKLAPGALFHSDAVQAFSKVPLDIPALGLGAVSISAHKLGGPIGTGALVLGPEVELHPLLVGGGQEQGRRAGTPDPAGAAGFAAAAAILCPTDWEPIRQRRDRLEATLKSEIEGLVVHSADVDRLPTHCHVGIPGLAADIAVIACDRAGLALSSGSSCSSGAQKASGVMSAMGFSDQGALRFSLGWTTTDDDIDRALEIVTDVVSKLRKPRDRPPAPSSRVCSHSPPPHRHPEGAQRP